MKPFVKSTLITGVLLMGANALMAGQASDNFVDQFYKAKLGRSSPMVEAQQRAENANVAYREEATFKAAPANTWFEDFYKAKLGRSSPAEEARLRDEQANTAYRAEPLANGAATNTWFRDYHKAKHGHRFPK